MREGSATVRFTEAEACQKYYDDTSNGVVYGKDAKGREKVCFVELATEVNVIGGLLRGWIDTGVTRCVRAVGVDEEYDVAALLKIGERKNRKVESVEDKTNAAGVSTFPSITRLLKLIESIITDALRHLAFLQDRRGSPVQGCASSRRRVGALQHPLCC